MMKIGLKLISERQFFQWLSLPDALISRNQTKHFGGKNKETTIDPTAIPLWFF